MAKNRGRVASLLGLWLFGSRGEEDSNWIPERGLKEAMEECSNVRYICKGLELVSHMKGAPTGEDWKKEGGCLQKCHLARWDPSKGQLFEEDSFKPSKLSVIPSLHAPQVYAVFTIHCSSILKYYRECEWRIPEKVIKEIFQLLCWTMWKHEEKVYATNQRFQKCFTQSTNGKIRTSEEIQDAVWQVKV